MSFSGLNSGVDRSVPLVNGVANNAVLYFSAHISQMMLQIIHTLHFCVVDLLMNYAQHFVANRIDVVAVWWPPLIWHNECMVVDFTQLLSMVFSDTSDQGCDTH